MVTKKTKLCIAFRVDSSKSLGLGHLIRCLAVADELAKKGIECFFIISNAHKKEIEKKGYQVYKVSQEKNEAKMIKKILEAEKCKALIFDSKRKSLIKIINSVRNNLKIVLIDNLQFVQHADLVILPGVEEQFRFHPTNCLIGPKYVLLNPEFKKLERQKRQNLIFLSAGGADKKHLTIRIVSAFKNIRSNFKLLVNIGKFYTDQDELFDLISNDKRFVAVQDPKNFPQLMSMCSLGIVTFGVTVYEAAFARLPVFVISHSMENDASARRMEKYGWFKYLGKYDMLDYTDIARKILSYSRNKHLLKKMSSAGNIIDGNGAKRVANAVVKISQS